MEFAPFCGTRAQARSARNRRRRRFAGLALLAALAAVPTHRTAACVYDGALGPGIGAARPRSIAVALSFRAAVKAGTLPAEAAALVPGDAGFFRALRRLRAFQRLLASGDLLPGAAVWILLVDSNLWTRLEPTPEGLALDAHRRRRRTRPSSSAARPSSPR